MGSFATSNPTGGSDITGSGTANQVAVFASASSIGNPTISFTSSATGFTIGSLTAEPAGILTLTSITQGFIPPRLTSAQRNAMPAVLVGMSIFNTTRDTIDIYTEGGGVPAWASLITSTMYPTAFTVGALLMANTTTTITTLSAGAGVGSYLRSAGAATELVWSVLTLPNAATVGDIFYSDTTNVMGRLASGATAGMFLRNVGASTAPVWSTLILPNAATANQIVYASATNTYGGTTTFLFNGTSFLVGTATQIGAGNICDFFRNQNGATSVWTTNNTSGTAAFAMNAVTADNGTTNTSMRSLSAGYTTSGMLVASTGVVLTTCTAGMNLGTFSNTQLSFWTNNTQQWSITSGGILTAVDAKDIAFGTTTGTKIGTATSQKLAFYNATPIVQGASIADASGGAIIDAEARTAINALISRIEATGLIATV